MSKRANAPKNRRKKAEHSQLAVDAAVSAAIRKIGAGQKAGGKTRAKKAALAQQTVFDAVARLSRSQTTLNFLAWTFVVSQAISRDSSLAHGWHGWQTQGDIDLGKSKISVAFTNLKALDTDGDQPLSQDASTDASANGSLVPTVTLAAEQGQGGTETNVRFEVVNTVSSYHWKSVAPSGGDYAKLDAAGTTIGGGPNDHGPHQPNPQVPDGPAIKFFTFQSADANFNVDLDAYAQNLGLGSKASAITNTFGDTEKFQSNGAIAFASEPLAPAALWYGSNDLSYAKLVAGGDAVNLRGVAQASGYTETGAAHTQSGSKLSAGDVRTQEADAGDKTSGNSTVLSTDDPAAKGLLWIAGNYYEFNTIIQINVTFNNDKIKVINAGGDDGGSTTISTGDNTQQNIARIIDGSDNHGKDGDRLIQGGSDQHSAVIQASYLTAKDKLDFKFDDVLTGDDPVGSAFLAKLSKFANIDASGDRQTNSSDISVGMTTSNSKLTADQFFQSHMKSPITLVKGSFWDINTIFQINTSNDSNDISTRLGETPNGTGNGIIASGGNIQLNDATILRHDHGNDLYVGGKYTQYNLVLQINVMQDDIEVAQSSLLKYFGHDHDVPHMDGQNGTSSIGHNGADGGHVNVSIPNPDDYVIRSGNAHDSMM